MQKTTRKIDDCMVKHLFDYKAGHTAVNMHEFLCDCDDCLDHRFDDSYIEQKSQKECPLDQFDVQNVIPDVWFLYAHEEERGLYV